MLGPLLSVFDAFNIFFSQSPLTKIIISSSSSINLCFRPLLPTIHLHPDEVEFTSDPVISGILGHDLIWAVIV